MALLPRQRACILLPRGRAARVATAAAICGGLALMAPASADAGCSFSTTGVAFGTYDVFAPTADDSTGSITYRCDNFEKNIRITLSAGTSGTFTARTLTSGAEALGYQLFLDAAHTTVWGDGSGGSTAYFIKNPPNRRDILLTVFGRVPAAQDVAVGTYGDTITATIEF